MPNIKSAIKRLRQNEKRNAHNRSKRSTLRTLVKKVRTAAESGEAEQAAKVFQTETTATVQRAATKHLIHKNKAARLQSQLAKAINAAKSAPAA